MISFIKKIFNYLIVRKIKIRNYLYYFQEIYLSRKFLKNSKKKNLVAFYDLKANGVSVGDFIFFCFYLRYFQIKGKFIDLRIIYKRNDINKDQKKLPYAIIKNFYLKMKNQFAQKILNKDQLKVRTLKWSKNDFSKIDDEKNFIIFKRFALKRREFKGYMHYIQNYFYKREDNKFVNKFKIKPNLFRKDASKFCKSFAKKKYISLAVRYSKYWGYQRNLKSEELIGFVNCIFKKKGKINILIISDKLGCLMAKKIYRKNKILFKKKCNLYFCKDFSKNIIDDSFLIMNSKCAFSVPSSGGIVAWLWYSNVPFLLAFFTSNILWFKFNVLKIYKTTGGSFRIFHFWNKKKQIWVNSPNILDFFKKLENFTFKF